MDNCSDIFKNSLGIREFKIEKVIRLGKKEQGKTRPILVKMQNTKEKWNVISNSKKLRNEQSTSKKFIYIMPDLTDKERENDKKLVEELKTRRNNGETNIKISRGKIVTFQQTQTTQDTGTNINDAEQNQEQ